MYIIHCKPAWGKKGENMLYLLPLKENFRQKEVNCSYKYSTEWEKFFRAIVGSFLFS